MWTEVSQGEENHPEWARLERLVGTCGNPPCWALCGIWKGGAMCSQPFQLNSSLQAQHKANARKNREIHTLNFMVGTYVKKKNLGFGETVEKWTSLLSLPPQKQKHMPIRCYTSATLVYPHSKFLSNYHKQEGRYCCNLVHVIPLAFTFVLCSESLWRLEKNEINFRSKMGNLREFNIQSPCLHPQKSNHRVKT